MGLVIILVILVVLFFTNVRIVPQAHAYVIERLGAYKTTWTTGLHLKVPFIERVARQVSLKEQLLDSPPQPVITKDNTTIMIDSIVFYYIFDAKLYCYGIENPVVGLASLTTTTMRNIIGDLELDETLTSRDVINAKMQQILDVATDPWGIKVTRVEVKNIDPPAEIKAQMEKQMAAERNRRVTVLEATAHRESVVSRAEGDKQAKILAAEAERDAQIALAEGRSKSIELVYQAEANGIEALKNAKINDSVLKLKGLEALKTVSDGRATKIFMPTELTGMLSSLGVVSEALGIGDSTPIDKSPKEEPASTFDPCCESGKSAGTLDSVATAKAIDREISRTVKQTDEE